MKNGYSKLNYEPNKKQTKIIKREKCRKDNIIKSRLNSFIKYLLFFNIISDIFTKYNINIRNMNFLHAYEITLKVNEAAGGYALIFNINYIECPIYTQILIIYNKLINSFFSNKFEIISDLNKELIFVKENIILNIIIMHKKYLLLNLYLNSNKKKNNPKFIIINIIKFIDISLLIPIKFDIFLIIFTERLLTKSYAIKNIYNSIYIIMEIFSFSNRYNSIKGI